MEFCEDLELKKLGTEDEVPICWGRCRMRIEHSETQRNFVFTQKELKEKLGITGDIKYMGLWAGNSPKDIEDGKDHEDCEWAIETIQVLHSVLHAKGEEE